MTTRLGSKARVFFASLWMAALLCSSAAGAQKSGQVANQPAKSRVLVKLRTALAHDIETALPLQTMTLAAGQAHSARAQGFMTRYSATALMPLYRELVKAKKTRHLSDPEMAAAVRQKFAKRAGRLHDAFAPPEITRTYVLEVKRASREELRLLLARLKADPDVEFAEENKTVSVNMFPDDRYFQSSGSWGQPFEDLWGVRKIGAPTAWDSNAGDGVVVAVVDTGIDHSHPDITSNVWTNAGEIPGNGIDDDGNGYVDDAYGWNFVGYSSDSSDYHGHGTHVAGTIAATGNNGIGVVGVAWRARVMPVKALDDQGNGFDSDLANAMIYATNNGADVINNSWNGVGASQTLADAINYAYNMGVVIVAAAGNNSDDVSNYYPANLPETITVAATDYWDSLADFSNRGSKIDVAAPGVDILSLQAAGTFIGTPVDVGYVRVSGTSMAAAHVSGAAALILSQYPYFWNEQVRQAIRVSANDLGTPGYDLSFGYGGLNAAAALTITDPLQAKIISPLNKPSIHAPLEIYGITGGGSFANYTLEYGAGTLPTQWTVFYYGWVPTSGFLGVFDPTGLSNGLYSIRLTVHDWTGRPFEDRIQVVVNGIAITSPVPPSDLPSATTFKAGAKIPIVGTAVGEPFQSFQVEWARGDGWTYPFEATGITLSGGGMSPISDALLATWTSPAVNLADFYTIRLTVNNAGSTTQARTMVYLEPDLLSANWPRWLDQGPSPSSGVVPALNADGSTRLLVASPNYGTTPGALFTISLDGSTQKTALPAPGYGSSHQPSAADLDGNPGDESVVADNDVVRVFRPDGSSYAFVPPQPVYFGNAQLVVEDLDGDSRFEVIAIGSDFNNNVAYIYAWRPDGTLVNNFPISIADNNDVRNWLNRVRLLVADIDGDGQKEIVVSEGLSASTYTLRVFGNDGAPRTWNAPILDGMPFAMAGADLDHNGKLETILASISGTQPTLHVFQPDGSERSGWPLVLPSTVQRTQNYVAVGDLDRNGREEIVFSDETGLYVFNDNGTLFPGAWPLRAGDLVGFAGVVIGDADGDGLPDIVTTRTELAGTSYSQRLLAIHSDGAIFRSWQLTGMNGYPLAAHPVPAIGDFNRDGGTDIAVVSQLSNAGAIAPGVVTVLSTGAPFNPAANDWPMIHQSARNTAVLLRDVGIKAITISPATLHFEQLVNTTSAAQVVTVSNSGNQPVSISGISVDGSYATGMAAGFAQTNNCGSSLPAGSSCTINLTFTPPARGEVSGVLQISDDAPSSPQQAILSGRGLAPVASLNPLAVTWASVRAGSNVTSVVTLTNSGDAVLNLGAFTTSGGPFAQTSDCPAALLPGMSCSVNVTFAPTVRGSYSGALSLADDAEGNPHTVYLSGTAVAPLMTLSPATLTWDSVRVGSTSSQLATLTNSGDAPLAVSGISLSAGPFSQTNDCPASLAPNASCALNLAFAPTTRGSFTGTVTIADDAEGNPHSINLGGLAVAPAITLNPATLAWSSVLAGSTVSEVVTLTNPGDAALTISAISASGAGFSQTNNCPASLAPNTSCSVTVAFAPSARGPYSGTITVSHDAENHLSTVSLAGSAVAPWATLNPASLSWTSVLAGSRAANTVTLSNTGDAPLTISAITTSGPAFSQTNTCPDSLAPNTSCSIEVVFAPTARGSYTGTLRVSDSADGSPHVVSLSGVSVAPAASLNPASLNWSGVRAGSSAWASVTVTNSGDMSLAISGISASGAPFSQTNNCPESLGVNLSCVITATFAPTARGSYSGTITISDNAGGHTIPLTGTATGPAASLSASVLDFGGQPLKTTSDGQIITLSNPGEVPLGISSVTVSGDFSETSTCGNSLLPGASCTIRVTFAPAMLGLRTGALTITDDAPGSPQIVPLSGYGSEFSLSADPANVIVVGGRAATATITVAPVGGPYPAPVALACSELPGEASCSIWPSTVVPGANGATASLTITTTSSTPTNDYKIRVRGTSESQREVITVTVKIIDDVTFTDQHASSNTKQKGPGLP